MTTRLKIWFLAARPKTLPAGIAPVVVASGLAFSEGVFDWFRALVCLFIALFFQIASNFANDYFDYFKGSDTPDRLGPKRAVSEGWVSPKAMLIATLSVLAVACVLGIVLMIVVDWRLVFLGVAITVFALAYSGGKYPLSYHGWGDVSVLVFYGIVPVVFTYYVQAGVFSLDAFVCGLIVGFASINILVANNYRDYTTDLKANKRTTVVILGKTFAEYFYLFNGFLSVLLTLYFLKKGFVFTVVLSSVYLLLHIKTWREMIRIGLGRELIPILGKTARNTLILSLSMLIGFLIGKVFPI
jgi:1,4-dihydroxy-2-naphthoate octaprenyltransferase